MVCLGMLGRLRGFTRPTLIDQLLAGLDGGVLMLGCQYGETVSGWRELATFRQSFGIVIQRSQKERGQGVRREEGMEAGSLGGR